MRLVTFPTRRAFSAAAWLLVLAACGGASSATSGGGATTTQAGPPLGSVREVSWATRTYPGLDLAADDELGEPLFADITGDGREEAALEGMAIIPDGNSYVTYVYLFTLAEGASGPDLLATVVGGDRADGSIRLTGLDAAGLHLARAILGPDDAMCCPSSEQHEVWTWNGNELVEEESARRTEPTEP